MGLVVVHRKWERHKQCRRAHSGTFGHGAGTGPADDQIGVGKGLGRVVDEGRQLGLHAGVGVVGAQGVDLLGAALVRDLRALFHRQQGQRLRHDLVQRLGAQAAADHQQLQRLTGPARGKAFGRVRLLQEGAAQRIADPGSAGQGVWEGREHPVSQPCQQPVCHAGHRVLFMQHQRPPAELANQPAREADVAAQTHQHLRLDATHDGQALHAGLDQPQRQQQQCQPALAAHAGEIQSFKRKTARRHQLLLHAVRPAEPVHCPTTLAQRLGHGQAREDMPAGAACHDEGRFHTASCRAASKEATAPTGLSAAAPCLPAQAWTARRDRDSGPVTYSEYTK